MPRGSVEPVVRPSASYNVVVARFTAGSDVPPPATASTVIVVGRPRVSRAVVVTMGSSEPGTPGGATVAVIAPLASYTVSDVGTSTSARLAPDPSALESQTTASSSRNWAVPVES